MKQLVFAADEYYHIYTRGVRKAPICHDKCDYLRLLYILLHFQGDYNPTNISRSITSFVKNGSFGTRLSTVQEIVKTRYVSLISFTIMPNHLHLGLYSHSDDGVSKYMQRVLNAYAKYFNEKYKQVGHLFQGKFGRVHIESNEQFLHTSAYIHLNQTEIRGWKSKEISYPWSSFQDYKDNRWGNLLDRKHILEQFDQPEEYIEWVKKSGAKGIGLEN